MHTAPAPQSASVMQICSEPAPDPLQNGVSSFGYAQMPLKHISVSELSPNVTVSVVVFFHVHSVRIDTCGTNSQPAVGVKPLTQPQIDALNATLTAMVPAGGTPIIGATINAYRHIHDEMQLPGNRFVVLISDGIDTCLAPWRYASVPNVTNATQALDLFNDRVAAAAAPKVNIRTFVIGVPGSEGGRAFLSNAAFLGGTASSATYDHSGSAPGVGDCHFDMAGSADFGADLTGCGTRLGGSQRGDLLREGSRGLIHGAKAPKASASRCS